MTIKLSDKVAALVRKEVERCNKLPRAKGQKQPDATAHEIVNEVIWVALRNGDISKGWK